MLEIVVGNVNSRIIGHLPPEPYNDMVEAMSYKVEGAHHMPLFKAKKWDGIIRLYSSNRGFYTGLMSFVRDTLKKHNIEYAIRDRRGRPEQNLPDLKFTPPLNFEDRDYQNITIDRAVNTFTRGILKVATGGGKTSIITRIIGDVKTGPFIFYVLTKDLMQQAYDELSTCLNCKIGRIGGGHYDIQDISVCTVQTVVKALHSDDKKFKISDYQHDDEDKWDEKDILSLEKARSIKEYIASARGIYFDECVTGDSIVDTEMGKVRIDEIQSKKCMYVLSHDENNVVYKKINRFWEKGERHILEIILSDGEKIRCTKEHLILTEMGWKKAGEMLVTDRVLSVNVDVEHGLKRKTQEYRDMCLGIKSAEDLEKNGQSGTSWKTIKSIKKEQEKQKVYDIEVDDTHCFFANNILVHNCHHAAARTVKEVVSSSPLAYWKFGGSATPYRDDGADIMIQAMFGSKIVDINASYLIKNNFLVKPHILFEPIDHECDFHSYKKVYEQCIAKSDSFNSHVAEQANHLTSRGLTTLVLVKQYNQGDFLKNLIPNSEFVTGRLSIAKRTQAINDIRQRKMMCMIATSLADEGLDIPSLDAALLAGGGASATRVNQRIGRTLRKSEDGKKDRSLVIAYDHRNVRFLGTHTKKVKKILKEEPEFKLITSKGSGFIFEEIDDIIGVKAERTLFDT